MLNNVDITLIVSEDKDNTVSVEHIRPNEVLEKIANILDETITKIEITK